MWAGALLVSCVGSAYCEGAVGAGWGLVDDKIC